jgi:hypothetical protein
VLYYLLPPRSEAVGTSAPRNPQPPFIIYYPAERSRRHQHAEEANAALHHLLIARFARRDSLFIIPSGEQATPDFFSGALRAGFPLFSWFHVKAPPNFFSARFARRDSLFIIPSGAQAQRQEQRETPTRSSLFIIQGAKLRSSTPRENPACLPLLFITFIIFIMRNYSNSYRARASQAAVLYYLLYLLYLLHLL